MKKIIIITLIVLLSSTLIYAEEPSSWAVAEVEEARTNGLVITEVESNFRNDISREIFCKLIVNMVEKTLNQEITVTINNPFSDINDMDVTKAYQLGIVNGTSATTFAPNNNITRQEIAAMMMRAARKLDALRNTTYTQNIDISGISFSDQSQIATWALNDIKELYKLGLMRGVGSNAINPLGKASIEQSILLSLRLHKSISTLNQEMTAKENLSFAVNENSVLEVRVSDLANGIDDSVEISNLAGSNSIHISADKKSFEYTAENVIENVSHDFNATLTEGDKSISVPFKIVVKNVSNMSAKENVNFEINENQRLRITLNDLVNNLANDAVIIRVEGAETVAIMPNKKAFKYTAEYVSENTEKNLNVTITENGFSIVVPIKISIKDVTLGFKESPEIQVIESESKTININDVFIDPKDDAYIIAVESSTIPEEQIVIASDKKTFTYKANQVDQNLMYEATLKISNNGRIYENKFYIAVNNVVNNNIPQKKYSGEYYVAIIPATEYGKYVPFTELVEDADNDEIKGVQIFRLGRKTPAGLYCHFYPINHIDDVICGYTTRQASGSPDSVQMFKVVLSDGKDNVEVKIKIIKRW